MLTSVTSQNAGQPFGDSLSSLSKSFEKQIKDEKLKYLWIELKPFIDQAYIGSYGEACQIFSKTLKITQIVSKQENMRNLWIKLLSQASLTLCRSHIPSHAYCFNSIIKLSESKQESFKIDVMELDATHRKERVKAENEINLIAQEALGHSLIFEVGYYEKILSNSNTVCLLAKYEGLTVGFLLGTYLTIQRLETQSVNVLCINLLARKADYPSIHFVELLQKQEERMQAKFPNTQYLIFFISPGNKHALQICSKLIFSNYEPIKYEYKDYFLVFFKKKGEQAQKPTYAEVLLAMRKSRLEALPALELNQI